MKTPIQEILYELSLIENSDISVHEVIEKVIPYLETEKATIIDSVNYSEQQCVNVANKAMKKLGTQKTLLFEPTKTFGKQFYQKNFTT